MSTLVPLAGRDYKSKAEVMKDWNEGKLFVIRDIMSPYDGKTANKTDLAGTGKHMIRYKRLTQICQVTA